MLPAAFLDTPIAHRGLHDLTNGAPENSRAAIEAAIAHGYGIEIDLQLTADGAAMVFHDDTLDRLTGEAGPVRDRSSADLSTVVLSGSSETIPDFAEVLSIVAGRVPLLVEVKDQDGALGRNVGPLENAVAVALQDYHGPVAVMSFNPHSVFELKKAVPQVPRGLVTDAFEPPGWTVAEPDRSALASIADFNRVEASFISHNHHYLETPPVTALKQKGVPVLCWTIRSAEEEAKARRVADNVTFEGYLPQKAS